jgi:hypothetical protein
MPAFGESCHSTHRTRAAAVSLRPAYVADGGLSADGPHGESPRARVSSFVWSARFTPTGLGALRDRAISAQNPPFASDRLLAPKQTPWLDARDRRRGGGVLLSAILAAHPSSRGILFDLPHVVDRPRRRSRISILDASSSPAISLPRCGPGAQGAGDRADHARAHHGI